MPEVLGPLADLIAVEPGYERLVEHALGGDLFAVALSSADVVGSLVARLVEDGIGEYSLVPVNGRSAPCPDGPGIPLLDVIRFVDDRAAG
ncbi:MAG: hypothetical protein N3B11_08040, partial [Coriobacteriia bacterium]|nr:hypothetical protein [Coriobacteriia bacterium]